jgi:hypothetical protein
MYGECDNCDYVGEPTAEDKAVRAVCPDDDDYPCQECGEPTDNGYDDGICCQCSGE